MAPGIRPEDVIVPVDRAEIRVHIPALADELDAGDVVLLVRIFQRSIEGDRVALDLLDPRHLEVLRIVHAHAELRVDVELGRVLHRNAACAGFAVRRHHRVAREGHTLVRLRIFQHGEGPQRHVVRESDRRTVRRTRVELEEVRMEVDLVRPSRPRIVRDFVLEDHVDAIMHVAANHQGNLLLGILADFFFLFVQHVDHADRVHDRGGLRRRRLESDRQRDRVDREELPRSILRTEAPGPLLARLRLFCASGPVFANPEGLQPGRPAVIRRERRPLPEVRTQPGKRQLAGLRIESDRRTLVRRRRHIVRPLVRRFRFVEGLRAVPLPVHDRRIVGLGLLHLILGLAGQALRRQHVFDPILDRHLDRIGLPIRLVLRDFVLLAPVPIDRRADQLVRADGGLDLALPVRQFDQRLHHVGLEARSL